MMWEISLEKLPPKGIMLLYFKKRLVFERYEIKNGKLVYDGGENLSGEIPVECHFFDERTEYRLIKREAQGDTIEIVLSATEEKHMDPDLLYVEEPLIKDEYRVNVGIPEKLIIVSRYCYSDNDIIELKNYRIAIPLEAPDTSLHSRSKIANVEGAH